MLTPSQIQGVANDITSIYADIEGECIRSIAKAIAKGKRPTSASLWQMKKLSDIGILRRDLMAGISSASKRSLGEVTALVTKALQESSWNDSRTLDSLSQYRGMSKADYMAKVMEGAAFQNVLKRTLAGVKDGLNLTNTKALQGSIEAYTKAINNAYLAMATGNVSFEDAVRGAVSQIGRSGIAIVDGKGKVRGNELVRRNGELQTTYSTGSGIRMYPLDSAVRRDITTQINQASAEMTLQDCSALGVTLVETSWHNGARPEHEVWQGKVFSLDRNDTRYGWFYGPLDAGLPAYGDPLGICGINCYHSFSPYVEGSPRTEQTGRKSAAENERQYENQQRQRGYERRLRALKREQMALRAAGYTDEARQVQQRLDIVSSRYRQFMTDNGLTRSSMLERVEGFRNIHAPTPTAPKAAAKYKTIASGDRTPSHYVPFGVVDRRKVEENAVFVDRYFFDSNGRAYKDISNNGHGERIKFGKNGEHAHDWIWKDGHAIRTTRELTKKEREECRDIL